MKLHYARSIHVSLGAMLALGLAAGASIAWAQDRGVCVIANVPEAFTLPDGGLHPAGRLTLCTDQAFTPVIGLHRLWVDGEGTTLAMSRRARAEENADGQAVLLFHRRPGSPLDLVGYVVPQAGKSWSYMLRRSHSNGFADTLTFDTARSSAEAVMIVASNLH
jgi:hypothetical protein